MKQKTFIISIIAIIAVFAVVFSLVSCNKSSSPKSKSASDVLSSPFSAKATIKLKDITLVGDISKTAVGCATMTITSPPTLNGMQFQYDGEKIKASYLGMSVNLNTNSKLSGGIIKLIVNAIDKAALKDGVSIKQSGKALIISGENDGTKFNVRFDKEHGSVASISMPSLDAECNFEDFLTGKP